MKNKWKFVPRTLPVNGTCSWFIIRIVARCRDILTMIKSTRLNLRGAKNIFFVVESRITFTARTIENIEIFGMLKFGRVWKMIHLKFSSRRQKRARDLSWIRNTVYTFCDKRVRGFSLPIFARRWMPSARNKGKIASEKRDGRCHMRRKVTGTVR